MLTFLLTIFRDLTEGILVGFALGAVLFIHRMVEMTGIKERTPLVAADRPDHGTIPGSRSIATCWSAGAAVAHGAAAS